MVDKRKRPVTSVTRKKIKLNKPQELPEVDNTRKEINKYYSKLLSKDARDRTKLSQKILGLLGEDLLSASKKHDLSRVIQACLKYGSEAQKSSIAENLRPKFAELAAGKYSYFLAKKLLKLGDKEELLAEVLVNAKRMVTSTYGIRFLDLLYKEGNYRARVLSAIFNTNVQDFNLEALDKESIESVKQTISIKKIFSKNLIDYKLVMHIVYIYLSACTDDEKYDTLTQLFDKFESLFQSRYGTILAIQTLAVSDIKQRKGILKSAQGLVHYIYDPESYAYLFFIKLIQVIDDTKRVNKMIILPIVQNMKNYVNSINGMKFLMHLLPYDFPSASLSTNEQEALEENLNVTSKKDLPTKKREIFKEIFPMFSKEIHNSFKDLINNPKLNILITAAVLAILNGFHSNDIVSDCREAVLNWEIMDNNCGHRILKKIIELEAETQQNIFTKAYFKAFKSRKDYLEKLIKSRGVWVLVALAEKSSLKNKTKKLLSPLKSQLDSTKSGEKALLDVITIKKT